MGFVGANDEVSIPGNWLFFVEIHTFGGSAPTRRLLIQLIWTGRSAPARPFDLTLPLGRGSDGCKR
jgi:hypothetical protein